MSKTNSKTIAKTCLSCSKVFYPRICVVRKGMGKFCSVPCAVQSMRKGYRELRECEFCHDLFDTVTAYNRNRFCSRSCSAKSRKGEKSNGWKGGVTPIHQMIRTSDEYYTWRDSVYIRDNYTCVACGYKGRKLNAHHILPFAKFPQLRFNIKNGMTLCEPCHKKTHAQARNNRFLYE